MSYDHMMKDITVATGASTASLAVIGTWTPGLFPVVLRGAALVFTTAAGAAGNCAVKHRPTAGSTSGETTLDNIVFDGTIGAQGNVVYCWGLEKNVLPGEQIAFEIDDVAASGVVDLKLAVQAKWEIPGNNTDMKLTA